MSPYPYSPILDFLIKLQARFFENGGHYYVLGVILLIFALSTVYGNEYTMLRKE